MTQVTKAWKLYGPNDHKQEESLKPSYKVDLSNDSDTRIYEVFNSDKTGETKYSIVKITTSSSTDCNKELDAQISDGLFEHMNIGEVEEILSSWDDVLDAEMEWLLEEFNRHRNTANIEYFFPNYKEIIENIDSATEDYTEFDTVAEKFSYSQEEWMQKIEEKFKPIIQKWFDGFCERNKDNEDYAEYIDRFWG